MTTTRHPDVAIHDPVIDGQGNTFRALIELILQRRPRLNNPWGATNQCKVASLDLVRRATKAGLHVKLLRLKGFKGPTGSVQRRWQRLPPNSWVHYVVQFRTDTYDLSALQFNPKHTPPHVMSLRLLRPFWDTITVVPNKKVMEDKGIQDNEDQDD